MSLRRKRITPKLQPTTRHIPQRTCLACRQVRDKRELLRVVYTPAGKVEVDPSGKKTGRGAYLCPVLGCWETGLKGDRLGHALRGNLTPENREQLLAWARDRIKGAD